MATLTSEQKQAVAKVFLDIAWADAVLAPAESALIAKLAAYLQISATDIKNSGYMSIARCLAILRRLDSVQKAALSKLMADIIVADGFIANVELEVFKAYCYGADIPVPNL